jgi:DNA-binding NarL/FixJ family response regulator
MDDMAGVRGLEYPVRRVAAGGSVIDSELAYPTRERRRSSPLDRLSRRQREVLELMAQGCSNQGICGRLWLTPKTVEAHIRTIFTKLDLAPAPGEHRRVQAVLVYLRESHECGLCDGP